MSQVEKVFEAIMDRHVEEVEYLIGSGVDVNAVGGWDGDSLLHAAAFEGHAPMVEMLIHKGANVNAVNHRGLTPLHVAVPCPFFWGSPDGFVKVMNLLLEHGADVNAAANCKKVTPLHFAAAYSDDKRAVALLLEHEADVDALDEERRKPIDWCRTGDISALLKEAKAKKDMKAQAQQTMQQTEQPKKNSSGPSFTPAHLL